MNRYLFLFFTLLLSQVSLAAIYKCEEGGKVSYNQHPCDANSRAMQINIQSRLIKDDTETANGRNTKVDDYSKVLESSRLTRQYKREIEANKKNIAKIKKRLKEKLAKLKVKQRHFRSVHTVQEFNRLKQVEIGLLKLKMKKKIKKLQKEVKNKKKAILKLKSPTK